MPKQLHWKILLSGNLTNIPAVLPFLKKKIITGSLLEIITVLWIIFTLFKQEDKNLEIGNRVNISNSRAIFFTLEKAVRFADSH
jgi:hypothetical protein